MAERGGRTTSFTSVPFVEPSTATMANNFTPQQQQQFNQQQQQQQGNPQAGGVVGPPPSAQQVAGMAAMNYFKSQGIEVKEAIQLAQANRLTPEQQQHFNVMMAAFALMKNPAVPAQGAPALSNNNNNRPPPINPPPSGPSTLASQSRPPGPINPQLQPPSASTPAQQERFRQLLGQLQNMTEAQRAAAILKTPGLANLWQSYLTSRQQTGKTGPPMNNVRPPQNGNNVRPPPGNLNNNSPVPALNLTLPPGRPRPQPQNGVLNNGVGRPPAMNLQQQQQRALQQGNNRVGSPANGGPQPGQQQQLSQQQQIALIQAKQNLAVAQQQLAAANNNGPANNSGPVPISRPQSASSGQLNAPTSAPPAPYPNAGGPRPTLSGGLASGPTTGTPALVQRQGAGWDEAARAGGGVGTMGAVGEARKRKIREVVDSVEKGEKVEEGVEDLLLELIDELVDSSVHFAARLAKHRKSSTLDVRDLQLHLERNHNIRVPGQFADEIRQGQSLTARRTPVLNQHAQRVAAIHAAKAAAAAKST